MGYVCAAWVHMCVHVCVSFHYRNGSCDKLKPLCLSHCYPGFCYLKSNAFLDNKIKEMAYIKERKIKIKMFTFVDIEKFLD